MYEGEENGEEEMKIAKKASIKEKKSEKSWLENNQ